MNNLLFVSDTHFDNWAAFSTTTVGGYNSRFIQQYNLYRNILEYARENKHKLIHAGDLFNRRLLIPSDVLHLVYDLIASYSDVIQYYTIGNHDCYGATPDKTILQTFSSLKHVNILTKNTQIYAQPNIHLNFVSYGEPIPAASTKLSEQTYQILVAHYGINEAKLGPTNYRMESDLTVKQIKKFNYDLALFGHIHKPQALADNIIVLGSTMAHSFHEVNEEKYFYVFDCEERKLVKFPTNAPKFLVHNINSEEELQSLNIEDGNYHRINIWDSRITFEDVKDFTAANVIVSFMARDGMKYDGEIMEDKGRTPQQEIEDYYNNLETELEKERLKDLSLEFMVR